jgi:hypothetical protein
MRPEGSLSLGMSVIGVSIIGGSGGGCSLPLLLVVMFLCAQPLQMYQPQLLAQSPSHQWPVGTQWYRQEVWMMESGKHKIALLSSLFTRGDLTCVWLVCQALSLYATIGVCAWCYNWGLGTCTSICFHAMYWFACWQPIFFWISCHTPCQIIHFNWNTLTLLVSTTWYWWPITCLTWWSRSFVLCKVAGMSWLAFDHVVFLWGRTWWSSFRA